MADEYSFELWKAYCSNCVEISTGEQKSILDRLLTDPEAILAWENLASSVRCIEFPGEDGKPYVICWWEALHNVLGMLLFPPHPATAPARSDYADLKKAILDVQSIIQKNASAGKHFVDECGYGLDLNLQHALNVCDLGEEGLLPRPLMPGKKSALRLRNWMALYLREQIIKPFFTRQHHEDIARLVNVTLSLYKDGDRLSEQDVRKLRPKNFLNP